MSVNFSETEEIFPPGEEPQDSEKMPGCVEESVESVGYGREDQATQTDDEDIYDPYPEPEDSPFKVRPVRPTNFNCKTLKQVQRQRKFLKILFNSFIAIGSADS